MSPFPNELSDKARSALNRYALWYPPLECPCNWCLSRSTRQLVVNAGESVVVAISQDGEVLTFYHPEHFEEAVAKNGMAYEELKDVDTVVSATVDKDGTIQTEGATQSRYDNRWPYSHWKFHSSGESPLTDGRPDGSH
ncbi:hypothetical protein CI109_107071 [Kwoniella shandongensis]|uniref:Uncharacterized protein n=1 Tax=Kwoniella shandongensis TaxID=1734106 RepID=A0A5M6BT43_9TREE|nr:uncharacterized protein CI109_006479 [Kwoniella shandongensis]KAA5525210.1 hypothetical protein CI109_006479 [Kwoniella shandongensis]